MPTFLYKAIAPAGETITGDIDAVDRRQVIQKLSAQDIKPLTITLLDQAGNKGKTNTRNSLKDSRRFNIYRPSFRIYSQTEISSGLYAKVKGTAGQWYAPWRCGPADEPTLKRSTYQSSLR